MTDIGAKGKYVHCGHVNLEKAYIKSTYVETRRKVLLLKFAEIGVACQTVFQSIGSEVRDLFPV